MDVVRKRNQILAGEQALIEDEDVPFLCAAHMHLYMQSIGCSFDELHQRTHIDDDPVVENLEKISPCKSPRPVAAVSDRSTINNPAEATRDLCVKLGKHQ